MALSVLVVQHMANSMPRTALLVIVATVYDIWATVLHQLGIDHVKLTYRWSGRDIRLTDVHGHVWKEILA